jgi:hypothetical protein
MPAGAVLAIVIVGLLIAIAAGVAAALEIRTALVRRRFGPEYDELASRDGHRRARAELADRKRHVAALDIRPLPTERARELAARWTEAQERFVDDPSGAVESAADLVAIAARERGYPDELERLLTDLSVSYPRLLPGYRRALQSAASAEPVPTEDLRQALLGFRAMFDGLAGHPDGAGASQGPGGPLTRRRRTALPQAGARREGRHPIGTPASGEPARMTLSLPQLPGLLGRERGTSSSSEKEQA